MGMLRRPITENFSFFPSVRENSGIFPRRPMLFRPHREKADYYQKLNW